jgi:DNA (cytosine-5)-methyltransferase 1
MREGMEGPPNSLRLPRHRPATAERFKKILETSQRGRCLTPTARQALGLRKHTFTPLAADQPSPTVTTLPDDILHYAEPRILTVRELARLQSFPDWFSFKGKYTTGGPLRKKDCPRYTQVGNAVPPLVAEAIGKTLYDRALENRGQG